ncbi:hypothetical protein B0I37DRAFT_406890 [Chaetomium sp. MPI-CAGE-AT-0009]|nr:hypothetical protein B0I37DRAFT_406890 [Chaetomium sp. MPI-CAGE-AT-0009]
MDAFEEMVSQVQKQVAAIDQLVREQGADPEALVEALVNPMAELNRTLAMGVSRLALPDLGAGLLGAVRGTTKKAKPLTLVGELLGAVANLLERLLTSGPVGGLVNGLLGDVLGTVTGTVSGALGGGGAARQVPDLLESILASVGAVTGGLPALP